MPDAITACVHLSARLARGEVVVLDGATGTEEARGVPMDDEAWCGLANLEYTDVVRDVHADYIRAGAAVVIANTFSTDRLRLGDAGFADRLEEINRNAVSAALAAREETGRDDVFVAGSLSRAAAFAIDGTPRPVGRARLLEVYSEQARLLADAGARRRAGSSTTASRRATSSRTRGGGWSAASASSAVAAALGPPFIRALAAEFAGAST